MVHYIVTVLAVHMQNNLEFVAAQYRPLFTMYHLWRSVSHELIKIETPNLTYTYITLCRCTTKFEMVITQKLFELQLYGLTCVVILTCGLIGNIFVE